MDKSIHLYSHLILGALVCLSTAASLRSKRDVIAGYKWPVPDPDIDHFPHESSCHHYYLVLSAEDITVNKCPDGELFDYVEHKCVEKEAAHCWSRHFGKPKHHHIHLKSKGQFRCPYAWGKYPDINDCTRYYVCLSGKVKHKKCAPFEHFDKISRKCVAAITGVCADKTDVVERGYKCPKSWGSFAFSKDCSKYYECLEKKPNLRTCPTDTLFQEKKGKCVPQDDVECGSRHNPYTKLEVTAKVILPQNLSSTSKNPSITLDENEIFAEEIKIPSEAKPIVDENFTTDVPSAKEIVAVDKKSSPKAKPFVEGKVTTKASPAKETSTDVEKISSEVNPSVEKKPVTETPPATQVVDLKETSSETKSSVEKKPVTEAQPTTVIVDVKEQPSEAKTSVEKKSVTEAQANTVIVEIKEKASKTKTSVEKNPVTEIPPATEVVDLKEKSSEAKTSVEKNSMTETQPATGDSSSTAFNTMPKETKSDIMEFPSKLSTSEVTEVSSEDYDSSNETDEIPDLNTNEFIEVSTTDSQSQTTSKPIGDSSQTAGKAVVTDDKEDECNPRDFTCSIDSEGKVIRCPGSTGLYPYPGDERRFMLCKNYEIHIRFCPGDLIYSQKMLGCLPNPVF